jgi:hypothetical protein
MIGSATLAAGSADESVQSGRAALGSHWSYPWYDESTDGARLIPIEPEQVAKPEKAQEYPTSAPSGGSNEMVVVVIGAILLGGLAWILARAYLKAESAAVVVETRSSREIDIARIEHLPFHLAAGKTDLLAEARRLYEQQRYGEAMVYLYSHQLLELDRLHVIHLAKGKTNRQYLREIVRQSAGGAAGAQVKDQFSASMVAFEDVFFGHHELERARFEACLAGVERLPSEQFAADRESAR